MSKNKRLSEEREIHILDYSKPPLCVGEFRSLFISVHQNFEAVTSQMNAQLMGLLGCSVFGYSHPPDKYSFNPGFKSFQKEVLSKEIHFLKV